MVQTKLSFSDNILSECIVVLSYLLYHHYLYSVFIIYRSQMYAT